MSFIYDKLEEISSVSSTKEKKKIISETTDDLAWTDELEELFLRVIHLAYTPFLSYNIKKIPSVEFQHQGSMSLDEALDYTQHFHERKYGRKETDAVISSILTSLSQKDADVFVRVLKRDLRCGCGPKTFVECKPDVVYIHPYQRCSSFSKKNLSKIRFPCDSEIKMDGMYNDIMVYKDRVEYRSREGLFYNKFNASRDQILLNFRKEWDFDFVIMGEAVVLNVDGSYMERKEGNGYLNRDDIDVSKVEFVVWDIIPMHDFKRGRCTAPRYDRKEDLRTLCEYVRIEEKENHFITMIESKECNSIEDIIEHFKDARVRNEEGTVVKNKDAGWEDGTSPDQVKIKIVASGEIRITGVEEGEGRLKGKAGSLSYMSSCGMVRGTIAGLSDNQREVYFNDPSIVVNKIAEVLYNDVVFSNTKQCYSLYLPRFVELRDKSEADDLKRLQESLEASIEALSAIG